MDSLIVDADTTVLMTVYNGEHYLRMALESVLSQTYQNFEFLIIDDCSTDHSVEIIHSFKDERIVLHANKENIGQTASLNKGLKLAKGKYIARIDADDLAFPEWLQTQYDALVKNPDLCVVSCNVIAINEKNQIIKSLRIPSRQTDFMLRSLIRSPINHVGSLIHREKALEYGGYDTDYVIAADYALWSLFLRKGEVLGSAQKTLMAIRFHESSISKKEKDLRQEQEISSIMLKNINHLSSKSYNPDDIINVYYLFYDTQELEDKTFDKSINIIKIVINNINKKYSFEEKQLKRFIKSVVQTAYLKRIFFYIEHKQNQWAGKIAWQGLKEIGFNSFFVFFYISSFMGNKVLSDVVQLCDFILRIKTILSLRVKGQRKYLKELI